MKKNKRYFLPITLFLSILGLVALTINAKTQEDFNLQQMGVESLVERHTFALEGSKVPQLQPLGDTFSFRGHIYAIKQPGQFVLGALVYEVIRLFGLTYQVDYVLTSSLVTLFTSGMLCAAIGVSLYLVATRMSESRVLGLCIGLCGSVSTILLPYAGVAHHDVQATALVCIAWSLLIITESRWKYFVSGLLTGTALFVSMLPVIVCIGVGLYVMSFRKLIAILFFAIGGVTGILPVFLYNWILFGSVFAFPNSISGTTDTTPFLSVANTIEKIQFYLISPVHSLFAFMPVLFFALIGLLFFQRKYRREALFIFFISIGHLAYVSSIETVGHAQYGPRYLLPILPFLALGLIGIQKTHPLAKRITMLAGAISFCIATVGAYGGAMYQTIWIHPFFPYIRLLVAGEMSPNPLRFLGIALLAGSCGLGYLTFATRLTKD